MNKKRFQTGRNVWKKDGLIEIKRNRQTRSLLSQWTSRTEGKASDTDKRTVEKRKEPAKEEVEDKALAVKEVVESPQQLVPLACHFLLSSLTLELF